ncbi:MAG: ATP-binding protein [Pseudomonadota bacterium]
MSARVIRKWRPPLAFVLGGTLAAVFFLPIVGIAYFRVAGGVLGWAETSWMIAVMAFVATGTLWFLLWRLVLRPVQALTAFAQSEVDGAPPVHVGTPEFSQLTQSVIEMTSRLRAREAVLRSYADHVTHELKSPLSAIGGAAELLSDPSLPVDDRKRLVANIEAATSRMAGLLDDQRSFARAHEPMPDGSCLLSDVAPGRANVITDGQIPLNSEVVTLVLGHLLDNAFAHGATQVHVDLQEDRLFLSDNGPGVSQGNRNRIFDPFFTTNRDGGGTGMGLAIVRQMLSAHGATIALRDGPGAVFEIGFD